jgi:hypothetical protein
MLFGSRTRRFNRRIVTEKAGAFCPRCEAPMFCIRCMDGGVICYCTECTYRKKVEE